MTLKVNHLETTMATKEKNYVCSHQLCGCQTQNHASQICFRGLHSQFLLKLLQNIYGKMVGHEFLFPLCYDPQHNSKQDRLTSLKVNRATDRSQSLTRN